jgi:hypothetical protein
MLIRPGAATSSELLYELANATVADRARTRFEPTDRLDQSDAERLVASRDASFEALRQIRRHLRRAI